MDEWQRVIINRCRKLFEGDIFLYAESGTGYYVFKAESEMDVFKKLSELSTNQYEEEWQTFIVTKDDVRAIFVDGYHTSKCNCIT